MDGRTTTKRTGDWKPNDQSPWPGGSDRVTRRRDRAVSTTLGYALTLGITSLLIVGLLVAGGDYVADQRQRAVTTELGVVGQQLASDIGAGGRLAETTDQQGAVSIERDLPERIAGATYQLSLERTGDRNVYTLTLESDDPEVVTNVSVYSSVPLYLHDGLDGGTVEIQSSAALAPKLFVTRSDEDPTYRSQTGDFDDDGVVEEIVVLEAESPLGTAPGSGDEANHYWETFHDTDASGWSAIAAYPNVSSGFGTKGHTGDSTNGPRLDYDVQFGSGGDYQVWVRSKAPSSDAGNSDSVHVGLADNGNDPASYGGNGVGHGGTTWGWASTVTSDGSDVVLDVPSSGGHTVQLWMREDGTQVDRIVLVRDPNSGTTEYQPTGTGPEAR